MHSRIAVIAFVLGTGCASDHKLLNDISCGEGTSLVGEECIPNADTASPDEPPPEETGSPDEPPPEDVDSDGYTVDEGDCDDDDASINPDALEECDGVDNDCDGDIDEKDADDATMWFRDVDGDDYGNDDDVRRDCDRPEGYVDIGGDCDDNDPYVNPGVEETWYDGVDADCAEDSDFDADGDGHDSAEYEGDDCDDGEITVSPSAPEVCDDVDLDEDCNDLADDDDPGTDPSTMTIWFPDMDGDGLGDPEGTTVTQCEEPIMIMDADIDFEDYPDGTNITDQYSDLGVHFAGSAYGIVGGTGEGDPGSWSLHGTAGSHFLGFNGGEYLETLTFDSALGAISVDVSRSNGSLDGDSFELRTYLLGELVDSVLIMLPGINTWETVSVDDSWFDEVQIQGFGSGFHPYGVDRLVFGMASEDAGYTVDSTDCDDTDSGIGSDC